MSMISPYIEYESFLELSERTEGRLEYHNGIIIDMSPTSIRHNDIVINIAVKLKNFFSGSKCKVHTEQVAILFENDKLKYQFQPDVFVICNLKKVGERYTSAPSLVFEVVSKATASNDLFSKPLIYEKFGVTEYNVVKQDGEVIQYGLVDNKYDIIRVYKSNDIYKGFAFKDLKFEFNDIFD